MELCPTCGALPCDQTKAVSLEDHRIEWPAELPIPFFVGEPGNRTIARWSLPPECFTPTDNP